MKYSMHNLYVIKSSNEFYFICREGDNPNIYYEVLTDHQIEADEFNISSLSIYCSKTEVMKYKTKKSLMLSKWDILLKYVKLNLLYEEKSHDYKMKEYYRSSNLVVANLRKISSDFHDGGPMEEITSQKYLFELITEGEDIKYQEVFTGYIMSDKSSCFDLPYVHNPLPLENYIPNINKTVHKYSLVWCLNDINNVKKERSVRERKNQST